MDELSAAAFAAYRGLVYETDGSERYFWASTVITEIASLNIGRGPPRARRRRRSATCAPFHGCSRRNAG